MTKKKNKVINLDGWGNILTNLGIRSRDRTQSNKYMYDLKLDENQLMNLYTGDGFAKKIVDAVANEMTREWFTVEGDTDNLITGALDEIDGKSKVTDLIRWSRLFGGAVLLLGVDDGQELDQPINYNNIRKLDYLQVFDRHQVWWTFNDVYGVESRNFGNPEFYRINPLKTATAEIVVHESRIIKMDGEKLPVRRYIDNDYWGDSVLQSCYTQLKNLGVAYGCTANIIEDFVQTVLSVNNLSDMLAAGQDDLIKKRLDIIDTSRHVANTILLDSEETYTKQASSVGGLDGLIDKFALALASVTNIPVTFLMGQAPAGLQATGQSDIRMFYDNIKAEQEDTLRPVLEKLTKIIMLSSEGGFNGRELENWCIKFNPLWQMGDQEKATMRKTVAETDQIYINTGVLDPSEVAIARFGGDSYSMDTVIDTETRENPEMTPEDVSAIEEIRNTVTEMARKEQEEEMEEEEEEEMPAPLPQANEDEMRREDRFFDILNKLAER
jgi:phage-related protein (TIGR01555 family)